MLDINLIRKNPEEIQQALLKQLDEVDLSELLEWDGRRRQLIKTIGEFRARRNLSIPSMHRVWRQADSFPRSLNSSSNRTGT